MVPSVVLLLRALGRLKTLVHAWVGCGDLVLVWFLLVFFFQPFLGLQFLLLRLLREVIDVLVVWLLRPLLKIKLPMLWHVTRNMVLINILIPLGVKRAMARPTTVLPKVVRPVGLLISQDVLSLRGCDEHHNLDDLGSHIYYD